MNKKILVIAEKPSVAADYAKALGQYKMEDGYYEGDKYIITWAVGHIISRKELYEYDENINRAPQNRAHVLETLPYFPKVHELKLALINTSWIKNDKARLLRANQNNDGLQKRETVIKKLFARNDISYIVNGADAGREGEAIFNQIYDFYKCKFPIKRAWLSSNSAEDIVKEFSNLRDNTDYLNLKAASYARAEMDWEHGLNLSALYSSLYGAQLSVGRVQTPVVSMIVNREEEILNFKSEDYFLLDACFCTTDNFKYTSRLVINNSLGNIVTDGKIKTISDMHKIISDIKNVQGNIDSISTNRKKENPKLLYSLSELQKEMDSKHKLTSSEVLNIAQKLYETHKIITYPRTSSQYLNESMKSDIKERLNSLPKKYDNVVSIAQNSGSLYHKVFNDKKIEDHYAMIPTPNAKNFDVSILSRNEQTVFDAIVKRFVAIFMPAHEYDSTILLTNVGNYQFKSTGKKIIVAGWKSLYSTSIDDTIDNDDTDKDQDLTYDFVKGSTVLCESSEMVSKKTQPPKRFTDGTLIAAMEVGGVKNSNITDQDTLDALKEKGLGTEATRAPLIENIISKGFVERANKTNLCPTQKGKDFMKILKVDILKSPTITGEWEFKLKQVERGLLNKDVLIEEVRNFIKECVEKSKEAYDSKDRIASGNTIGAKCPLCGGDIIKTPKVYFCDHRNDGCKFVVFSTVCNKKISDTHVKDICSKGITKLIKGFANPNKKDTNGKPIKFDACLMYDKENNRLNFTKPDGKGPQSRKETDYICPKCGKHLVEFESGFGCSGYKDGCRFSFYKNFFNITLSKSDIEELLHSGETKAFEGLVHPKNPNKSFNAKLKLSKETVEVIYLNANNEVDEGVPTKFICPCCGKPILEFERYFKCSKCKFAINKIIAGYLLDDDDIISICVDKEMNKFVSFTSAKGTPFKAKLKLNTNTSKIEFEIETKMSNYKCPLCSSSIGETDSSYKCTGCGLTVWKKVNTVELTTDIVAEIFTNMHTKNYIDLVSSKGKPFKARLVVDKANKKVVFEFEPRK